MPYFAASVEIARDRGFFDRIGLHLNLTFGTPLTEGIKKCRRICDCNGSFNGAFHTSALGRLLLTKAERLAITEEVGAQMDKFVSYGFPLMHLDSHHHSHTDFSIVQIVLPLARKYGFQTIRLSRNVGQGLTMCKRLYKALVNHIMCKGFLHADCFGDASGLDSVADRIPDNTVFEIMTHPTYWQNNDFSKYVAVGDMYDWHTPINVLEAIFHRHSDRIKKITYADLLEKN